MKDNKVYIEVIEGSCQGQRFECEEQKIFKIGTAPDCQCIIKSDITFSRHHLLLENIQSNVTLKDLGSLNGTRVNGCCIYEGRGKDVTPEKAKPSQPVGLYDGDRIEAGNNVMILHIAAPAVCVDCGAEISDKDKKACEFINGSYICLSCRKREAEKNKPVEPKGEKKPVEVRMNLDQRKEAENNPGAVMDEIIRHFINMQGVQDNLPEILGYADLKEIDKGGFGIVYKARRTRDGEIVALKTMLQTRKPDRRNVLLFEREKEIISQLKHPNIVRSEAVGVWNDIHFIEMEFIDGGSIGDMMKKNMQPIDLKTAAPLILQMLEGLAYAHEAEVLYTIDRGKEKQIGIVHRDLKPANVMLARENGKLVAKLSDFGLGKAFGATGHTQGALSQDGTACGTPEYMAIEHLINNRDVKPSTDVFEMAATIFHILTGQFIRSFAPGRERFKCIIEEPVRHINDFLRGCPKGLSDVIDRALAVEAKDRYVNGREFLKAIKKVL
jgi:tRNA A-37 threonylcarbamoyl transferase component Bud32